jgi:hypothetical protein
MSDQETHAYVKGQPERPLVLRGAVECEPSEDPEQTLLCPRCHSNYLHHGAVTVYERKREDDVATMVSTVEDGLVGSGAVDNPPNPSRRRSGLAIDFDCEECGDGIQLTVAQHKGLTLVCWRFAPSEGNPYDEIPA